MSIFGIGTDLLETSRIEKAYARHELRFVQKLLASAEMDAFHASKTSVNFLAKRWAAKEAVGKALGTGIAMPFVFPHIIIGKTTLGQPTVSFATVCDDWLMEKRIGRCHLSISDEVTHILAFAVVERNG